MGLRKKKETVLSHDEMIAQAKGKLDTAQIIFVQAKDEVDAADQQLDQVIAEAIEKMKQLEATLGQANKSKENNAKFQAKLKEFIIFD